ncbi:MAG: hypothetical protein Q8P67_01660 [archaeon]|nr:hypothetical protein [archaeon]
MPNLEKDLFLSPASFSNSVSALFFPRLLRLVLRIAHLVHLVISLKHLPGVLFVKKNQKKSKKKSSKKSSKKIIKKKSSKKQKNVASIRMPYVLGGRPGLFLSQPF